MNLTTPQRTPCNCNYTAVCSCLATKFDAPTPPPLSRRQNGSDRNENEQKTDHSISSPIRYDSRTHLIVVEIVPFPGGLALDGRYVVPRAQRP